MLLHALAGDPAGGTSALDPDGLAEKGERIRAALELPHQPLPNVDADTLSRYHRFLARNLALPFSAEYPEAAEPVGERFREVLVLDVLDPRRNIPDDFGGIYCRVCSGDETFEIPLAELEVPADHPNHRLVEDYWYWFWNWR